MATIDRSIDHARLDSGAAEKSKPTTVGDLLFLPPGNPDEHLFDLVLEARRLASALAEAEAALDDAQDAAQAAIATLYAPTALIFTARDRELFPRIECEIGDTLSLVDVQIIRAVADGVVDLYTLRNAGAPDARPTAREMLARAAEIDAAGETYYVKVKAARERAGVAAAEDAVNTKVLALAQTWREIAFTPARTILGVLSKLECVARHVHPLDPSDFSDTVEPDDVAITAASDLGALLGDHREA